MKFLQLWHVCVESVVTVQCLVKVFSKVFEVKYQKVNSCKKGY